MPPHRHVFKKLKVNHFDYLDFDVEPQPEKQAPTQKVSYFHDNGFCRAHDREGCNQCRHYANGRCPSSWEEATT